MRPVTDRNTPDKAGAREAMHEARPNGRRASCWRVGTKRDRAAVVDQHGPRYFPVCSTGHISRSDTICKIYALLLCEQISMVSICWCFKMEMYQQSSLKTDVAVTQILLSISRGIIDLGNQKIPFSDNQKDLGMRDVLFWRKCFVIWKILQLFCPDQGCHIDCLNFSK